MDVEIYEKNKTTKKHGHILEDEYAWMKKNKDKSVKVIKKLNKATNKFMDSNIKIQKQLEKEFKNRIIEDYETIPTRKNHYEYQYVIKKGENYGKYYYISQCKKEILMDCEKMAKGHEYWDMAGPLISRSEDTIVYGIDFVGDDENRIFFRKFNETKGTEIKNPKGLRISSDFFLASDSVTFYYVTMDSTGRYSKVWCTRLDDLKYHKCIYSEKDKVFNVGISTTYDSDYVLLYTTSSDVSEILLVESKTNITTLFSRKQEALISVDYISGVWYVLFEKNNKTKMLFSKDKYCNKLETWLPYKKGIVYEYFVLKRDYMIIGSKKDGIVENYVYLLCDVKKNYKLNFEHQVYSISFPALENINKCTNNVIVYYENWLVKGKKIEINLETKQQKVLKELKIPGYDENKYVQERVTVKDKLVMTMLRKKSTKLNEGPHQCMIEGYGAYGSTHDPEFDIKLHSLLDRGFIYCIAHIRGSGYYDTEWYKDGKMLNKMNSFKDFIACIDYVLDKKYTIPDKVTIFGRSAGGLLMGAVLNMAPEKVNFALIGVPFVDVVNTMLDDSLNLTTGEYNEWGNPNEKKYFDYMLKYSPYDNIDLTKRYPNIYLYGNLNDSRVSYWEPLKYYARIRKSNCFQSGEREINIHINTQFGHSQSSERYEELEEYAKLYSTILNYAK